MWASFHLAAIQRLVSDDRGYLGLDLKRKKKLLYKQCVPCNTKTWWFEMPVRDVHSLIFSKWPIWRYWITICSFLFFRFILCWQNVLARMLRPSFSFNLRTCLNLHIDLIFHIHSFILSKVAWCQKKKKGILNYWSMKEIRKTAI